MFSGLIASERIAGKPEVAGVVDSGIGTGKASQNQTKLQRGIWLYPTQKNIAINEVWGRSLKNGRPMASFLATETNLISVLRWSKDFVQRAGRVLSPKALKFGKCNAKTGYYSACHIAALYADLGDKDQAFRWLNTAYQERDYYMVGLKTSLQLDPLRSDPRFAELVRKVGLPQ